MAALVASTAAAAGFTSSPGSGNPCVGAVSALFDCHAANALPDHLVGQGDFNGEATARLSGGGLWALLRLARLLTAVHWAAAREASMSRS